MRGLFAGHFDHTGVNVVMSKKKFYTCLLAAFAAVVFGLSSGVTVFAAQQADWTILSYLSADNDLEKNALCDINEMENAGPGPNINMIIQLDRPQSGYNDGVNNFGEAVRIKIQKDKDPVKIGSPIVSRLGNINSGDPKTLSDFIEWGVKNYPAKRYILTVWSHGSGWKTIPYENISRSGNDKKGPRTKYLQKLSEKPEYYFNNLKSMNILPLSRATGAPLLIDDLNINIEKSISYDDTSKSAITLNQLHDSIKKGCDAAGLVNGFDILWFDACLMSMIEVASAVSDCGSYMIASEEVTPDEGWNHVKIVNMLNKSFELPTADIAKMIASKFVESYRRKSVTTAAKDGEGDSEFLPVTMNAINLAKAAETVSAINAFVKTAADPVLNPALTDSLAYVQRFKDPDYVDLINFVDILSGSVSSKPLASAAAALKQKLSELIIISKNNSPAFKNARGVSIYFPVKDYDSAYDAINFSKSCDWNQFIKSYLFPKNSEVVTFENCLVKSANNDGRISPNDNPELSITLLNTGSKTASGCRFVLTGKNAGVRIVSSEANAAGIKPGERAEISFKLSAASAKAGQKLSFDLNYTGTNPEMTVKIATLTFEVKQPFAKTSNLLLVFGTVDQTIEKQYCDSLNSISQKYDIWRSLADGPLNAAILNKYINGGSVFRIVPDSSIQNKITRDEVLIWESYLKKGGSLLITGQDVGAMISETPLYTNFLKCNLNSDSGGTTKLSGMDAFAGRDYSLNGADSANNQIFLDDIAPRDGATPIFKYDNQKIAGVLVKTPEYRVIYLAFGLEAVTGVNERAEIISKALKLLPFSVETGLAAVSEVSSSKDSPEAALTNIERTRESIISDLNESKYASAEQLAAYVSGLETPGAKEPFKPVVKTISEMLRSKLIQSQSISAEETAAINSILSKINAIK